MKTVTRPWGSFRIIAEGPGYWVKILKIKPGHRTSLQKHRYRDEVFVTHDGKPSSLKYKVSTFPKDTAHRITNKSKKYVRHVLEIGIGDPFEEDIFRIADDYGRETQ